MSTQTQAPGWFVRALAQQPESRRVAVAGASIHYLAWGRDGGAKPGILLVHGNGAHAHWWSFIAPFFLPQYQVVAVDLAGMGDSDHREAYTPEGFAEDLMAVISDAGLSRDTVIVGHSFGGFVTLKAGLLYPDRLGGIVLADSAIRPPDFNWERDPRRAPVRPKRVYADFDSALARFRLMPPQDCDNQYILDYIGRHSIKPVSGGYTWKFDDELFSKFRFSNMAEDLANLRCRVGVLYGDSSYVFNQEIADFMFKTLGESVPFAAVPESQHHLFLDQPLAFVAALRTLLAEWQHSKPLRGS